MKELLVTIASALVEDKSAVQVTVDEPDAEGVVVYHLHVAQEDMGRVIGKQGRIAKAIRTVMRAGAVRACRIQRTPENKCMCEEFRRQIADPDFEGYCHCMLYYKSK